MSDPGLATRTPENDIAEDKRMTEDAEHQAPVETGPSLGEHCVSDRALPHDQAIQSSGEVVKFGDTDVYVSKPADYPTSPGKLLLFLTSGTGVHSINNQLQADHYAKEGYVVVMPDQFAGDPAPNSKAETEEQDAGLIEQIKLRFAETAKSFLIDMWLARHTPEKVLPIITKVLERAQEEFADAVANGSGVYAAGYCFGAKYVIILAGERPDTVLHGQSQAGQDAEEGMVKKGPLIKAGAIAHPTLVGRDDFKPVKAPLTMVCVEDDPLFPQEILDHGKKELSTNQVDHEVKMYAEVPHGFAVVGDYASNAIKEAQVSAFDQMLQWLNTH